MSDTERRPSPTVYGIENEYSCMITLPGDVVHEIVGSCHSVDSELGLYQEPDNMGSEGFSDEEFEHALEEMGIVTSSGGMLSNGGRLYIDPSGPEYAGPETTTAEEAVHRSFDGDEILAGAFDYLLEAGVIEGFQINRRIVDHNRSSRGVHLNTMTNLTPQDGTPGPGLIGWLATLNVAKGAIFGSGGLLIDEQGETSFHHSPRLSLTTHLARDYEDFMFRPLVRFPFKGDGPFRRIETVTSDALNFAWPLRASLVATNAVVGVVEMGYGHRLPRLKDPVFAARAVGCHGKWAKVSSDIGGGEYERVGPLNVLREAIEVVLEIDEVEEHLDDESLQVLPEILDVADKMDADMYSVASQVESVSRLLAMRVKMKKDRLKLGSEKMCRFDYAWDWIHGGIAENLRHKNKVGWHGFESVYSATETKARLTVPPQDTRAKVRGGLVLVSGGKNAPDWDMMDFGQGATYVPPLSTERPGPLSAHDMINYYLSQN